MTNKRIYALTDEQAKWLGYYAKVGGYPALDEVLIPLDRDDTVERMARAILQYTYGGSVDLLSHNFWDAARGDAHAALDALLGTDEDERYKHV